MSTFCKGCGGELERPLEQYDVFEGMHWFCFHYSFEHLPNNPEVPCESRHCPTWHLEILRNEIISMGKDPDEIIEKAILEEWSKDVRT